MSVHDRIFNSINLARNAPGEKSDYYEYKMNFEKFGNNKSQWRTPGVGGSHHGRSQDFFLISKNLSKKYSKKFSKNIQKKFKKFSKIFKKYSKKF